jgi:hypothetical protein
MANEFVARNGVISLRNSTVSGSLFVTGSVGVGVSSTSYGLEVAGTSKFGDTLTTNVTDTQLVYSSTGALTGSTKLIWDNTNGYLVNQGYYFLDFPLSGGGGFVSRQQSTSNLLMQMGFNAQAQYGGTIGTISGNQFFVYNFQGAGGASNYYWGFNNSGDNYWGSSNTLYSVKVQQPSATNIPLSVQGQPSQTNNLFTVTTNSGATVGNVMTIFSGGTIGMGQTSNAGYKLDINGTTRIQNKLTLGNSIIASGGSEGTSGQVLTSNGIGSTPSWTTVVGGGGSISTTGTTLYSTSPAAGTGYDTTHNIFFGLGTGNNASGATYSNFIGYGAGWGSNSQYSNFLGWQAGATASFVLMSNFLGYSAGKNATYASYSNFIGPAGLGATHASYSNFLGNLAGENAYNAGNSNIIGNNAGYAATHASYSNFLGQLAGAYADSSSNSTLIGYHAGMNNSSTPGLGIGPNNIIIGTNITLPTGRKDSFNIGAILFGTGSYSNTNGIAFSGSMTNGRVGINNWKPGYNLDVTGDINFSGNLYQNGVIYGGGGGGGGSISTTGTTLYSTSPAAGTGYDTTNNIFFGGSAGSNASGVTYSNFIGYQAGSDSWDGYGSNFIGNSAGLLAYNANSSNFLGTHAGQQADNANNSNFFGYHAGKFSTGADHSNFFGENAGYNADNANYSNFFGPTAGDGATYASYSNFLGYNVGAAVGGSVGSNNIIIGTNITLNNNQKDSINIGGLIFGTGSYSDISTNPYSGSQLIGKIGINNPNPIETLDVSGSGKFLNSLKLTGSFSMFSGSLIVSSSAIPLTYNPFADDYNRASLSPGGSPSLTYTQTNVTGTGAASIISNYLNIVNGATAGKTYVTVPISGFSTPFSSTLSSNAAQIEWTFNVRTNRSSAVFSGFGTNQYGGAFVLVGSNTNIHTAGQGYALVYGGDTFRNWRLVRFNNGIGGTLTNIVTAGTNIFSANANYVSIRVTYLPSSNTWALYFRDDGGSAWVDASGGVTSLIGSSVDSTYTNTAMSVLGFLYSYATTANQNLQFDNVRIYTTSPSAAGTVFSLSQDGEMRVNTDVLYVSNTKNVSIGTTAFNNVSPERLLISGSNTSPNLIVGKTSINGYSQINIFNTSNGVDASADIVASNDSVSEFGNFIDMGINSSNFSGTIGAANEAYLYNTGSNLWIGNATPGGNGNIRFFAGNNATAIAMHVSSSQQVFISSSLVVGQAITTSNVVGRIDASNDVVAFSTSDIRLKENILPIGDAISKIESIGGYTFDWKKEHKDVHGYEGHDVGVIAQEIEKILPEVVTTRDNGYKAVKYEKIVPLLIEAIKSLQKQIDELKSK